MDSKSGFRAHSDLKLCAWVEIVVWQVWVVPHQHFTFIVAGHTNSMSDYTLAIPTSETID